MANTLLRITTADAIFKKTREYLKELGYDKPHVKMSELNIDKNWNRTIIVRKDYTHLRVGGIPDERHAREGSPYMRPVHDDLIRYGICNSDGGYFIDGYIRKKNIELIMVV